MEPVLITICIITCLVAVLTLIIVLIRNNHNTSQREIIDAMRQENALLRQELNAQTQLAVRHMGDMLLENQRDFADSQSERTEALENRMKTFSLQNEMKLENIRLTIDRQLTENRETLERRMDSLQKDNSRQLEEMRKTVDERLEKSLEDKMNKSFSLVSQRLEQVYKGLGEMQHLATGVGDLKKVLSNVKTRGILGELQLGAILSEVLSPSQY